VPHARIPLRSTRCSGGLLATSGSASRHWRFEWGWRIQHGLEFERQFHEFVELHSELLRQFLLKLFFFGKFRKFELFEQFLSQFRFFIRRRVWLRK